MEENDQVESENLDKRLKKVKKFLEDHTAEVFTNSREVPYITLTDEQKVETMAIYSTRFRRFLNISAMNKGSYLTANKTDEFIAILAGLAQTGGIVKEVNHRIGNFNGDIIVHLGIEPRGYVYIGTKGWRYENRVSIPFEKSNRQVPLPRPTRTTTENFLKKFKRLFNLKHREQYIVILAAIVNSTMKGYGLTQL